MKADDDSPRCQCCQARGKYYIAGNYVCGRHLAMIVELEAPVSGGEVRVRKE